jgi:N-acyl homoserine lactone hydrolase
MGVSVETRPAQLPLPGGQAGATVRVHPLLCGEMHTPPRYLDKPKGPFALPRAIGLRRNDWVWIPVPAFLIEHPGVGPILVDTGFHPSVAFDPRQSFGTIGNMMFTVRMRPEQALHAQLRDRGFEPDDVRVVVMTHMHFDHTSGVSEFAHPTYVVNAHEWESAIGPRGQLRGYRTQMFDYGFDWRTVDFERPEVDSFATFGQAIDLFGDGSLRLLSTPGHSDGHMSVLARLSGGELLITGDAAYERRAIEESIEPLILADRHLYFRSLKEIGRYIEQTPGAIVIPGHDREVWPTLRASYE